LAIQNVDKSSGANNFVQVSSKASPGSARTLRSRRSKKERRKQRHLSSSLQPPSSQHTISKERRPAVQEKQAHWLAPTHHPNRPNKPSSPPYNHHNHAPSPSDLYNGTWTPEYPKIWILPESCAGASGAWGKAYCGSEMQKRTSEREAVDSEPAWIF
jgi:hypothetical protein